MQIDCPGCSKSITIAEDQIGQTVACPHCGAEIELADDDEAQAPPASAGGGSGCPQCGKEMAGNAVVCIECGYDFRTGARAQSTETSSTAYSPPARGPATKTQAPTATHALIFGVLSLLCCPPIFGILAITKGMEAQKLCREDDRFTGAGLGLAGVILGIIGIILWGLGLILRFSGALDR